jgi:hypothetical protein
MMDYANQRIAETPTKAAAKQTAKPTITGMEARVMGILPVVR